MTNTLKGLAAFSLFAAAPFSSVYSAQPANAPAAPAEARPVYHDAIVTIYLKSGAIIAVMFQPNVGTLKQLKADWEAGSILTKPRTYTYESVSSPHGQLVIDLSQIAAVHLVDSPRR